MDRLSPNLTGRAPAAPVLSWARPAAAADVLGVAAGTALSAPGAPVRRLSALTVTDPFFLTGPHPDPVHTGFADDAARLLATTGAVRLHAGPAHAVLWAGGADLLDSVESVMAALAPDTYLRDGDELRHDADSWDLSSGRFRLAAAVGEDLLLTTDDSTDGLDAADSAADSFADLPGLLAVIDLEDAHVALGTNVAEYADEEGDAVLEWVWATRFVSEQEHSTVGAVRVRGDADAIAQQLRDGAEQSPTGMRLAAAEVDGDVIRMHAADAAAAVEPEGEHVAEFYAAMTTQVLGPGVSLGAL